MEYEPVIGLEVHAELETRSKMFCACPVVDPTQAAPNSAVCPVCAGMPGVLPVVNQRAVEFGLRVALALECQVDGTSLFARKNYFYPDLPKGYQISQYEQPLASHGWLAIETSQGERLVRIRRVHLEEDTGKLTHVSREGESYSLVDLNRAGVPLLEIVTEPDLHTGEEVRAYAMALRSLLRYLGVNSGDMQKGVLRIEPNISVRPLGSPLLGTRVEIKNLNSFRSLERAVAYEIERQADLLRQGLPVRQETVGWDVEREVTVTQRVKEQEDDYRYFPEPDLPPLVLDPAWIEAVRASLPELPHARLRRFEQQYGLSRYDASVLVAEREAADYYEQAVDAYIEQITSALPAAAKDAADEAPASSAHEKDAAQLPKTLANWVIGELFGLLNQAGLSIEASPVSPPALAGLVRAVVEGEVNQNTAKAVLAEMFISGQPAEAIIIARGLRQISDARSLASLVAQVLEENPAQVAAYIQGREAVKRWLFGQVMRLAGGQANPQVLESELERQLAERRG